MKPPTVWHIGGDDIRMRIPLLLTLRERGFHVGAAGSEDTDEFLTHGIPYWRYPLNRGINPLSDLRSWIGLYALFKEHAPDIIHAFDTKPIMFCPLIAKAAGIRGRVRTVTGMGYLFSSRSLLAFGLRPIYRVLQRWAGYATAITIFQNPDDREYFVRHNMVQRGREIVILGSGIDIERFIGQVPSNEVLAQMRHRLGLDGQIVVTMVARLVKTKGVAEYIKAAGIVRQQRSDVVFLLVGPIVSEGRQAVSLKTLDSAGERVRYLGERRDVAALLALTDVFVLPSYYREGVPRALIEAGAIGLPLVTTDMAGCKEVVRDGWNGLIVPPRNVTYLSQA
ncbi:MAG: glycosyltransferase family 4 protein, partial [Gammaproteobacteria bacterium]